MGSSSGTKSIDTASIISVSNGNLQEGLAQNEDEERILRGTIDGHVSQKSSSRTLHRYFSVIKGLIVDQWFLVALGSLVLISSQVQVSQPQQEVSVQNLFPQSTADASCRRKRRSFRTCALL